MAQMNYPHAPDGCRPGERVVFNCLKRYLPDDYFVWVEPTVHGRKFSARPDFVVLGADIGLVILEVKDWSVDNIRSATRDRFEVVHGSKVDVRTNPEQQATKYVYALKDQLRRYHRTDPEKYRLLVTQNGSYEGTMTVPISALAVFPNIARHHWTTSELQLPLMLNETNVLLQEDLRDQLLERVRSVVRFPVALTPAQLDALKWMLYPQTRVPWSQGRLFTLDADQIGIARIDTYLPTHAQQLAQKPQAKLIRGVVGSGKTLILLYRAKFISEQNDKWRVLVLTYNKSLRDYMREIFKQIGGDPERVEIVNFHKWCYDMLSAQKMLRNPMDEGSQKGLITRLRQESKIAAFDPQFLLEEFNWIKERLSYKQWDEYPDPQKVKRVGRGRGLGRDEAQKRAEIYDLFQRYQQRLEQNRLCDWADIPVMVSKAMEAGLIEPAQYHAVLIDEAQDFAPAWFRVAFEMVKSATKMVFIVGDGAQKIYRRDFTWKELGLGITAQNSYVLKQSYRSTHEIVDVALEVIRGSQTLLADIENAGDSLVEPEKEHAELLHGPVPVLLGFESSDREYAGVGGEILSLLQQGYLPKDIVILQRRRDHSDRLAQELRQRGIACKVIKGDLNITEPVVKISTCHSVKGLEFEVVFICGLEDFKPDEPVETESEAFQELLDQERKLLYVGLTRARRLLYITYSGVAPDWIVERLQHKLAAMQPQPA